jgi:hypothetical protein
MTFQIQKLPGYYKTRFTGQDFFDKTECISPPQDIEIPDGFKLYKSWERRDLNPDFKREIKKLFALTGQ